MTVPSGAALLGEVWVLGLDGGADGVDGVDGVDGGEGVARADAMEFEFLGDDLVEEELCAVLLEDGRRAIAFPASPSFA